MAKRKKRPLSRNVLIALGIPAVFIPGLILASLLGWDWQHDLSRLEASGGYKQSEALFPKAARVNQIIDGDTILIDTGHTVRLLGIDAPNRGERGYDDARDYLQALIDGETVTLEYDTYQDDKFGRVLAYVWEDCSTSWGCRGGTRLINAVLIHDGYAQLTIYKDRKRLKYEDLLRTAN